MVIFICYLIFIQFPDNGFLTWGFVQGNLAVDPRLNPQGDSCMIRGADRNADNTYTIYSNLALLVFLGFGLLWTLPRKATWTALGLTILVGAYAMELGILVNGWFSLAALGNWQKIYLNPISMLEGLYCAATCIISYGAIIGQLNPMGLLLIVTVEAILYCVNYYLGASVMRAQDFGRSMFVDVFGAFFGLAVAWSISNFNNDSFKPKELKSSTWSTITSTMGCLVCFALYPAFNTGLSQYWSVDVAVAQGVVGFAPDGVGGAPGTITPLIGP